MKKTSDVLGESAVDGLAKIGHLGGGALVRSLAGVIDVLRTLGRAAIILFEAAIVPVMFGIQSIFTVLHQSFLAFTAIIKGVANAFGYVGDAGTIFAVILKGIGYYLGVLITGFLFTKAFQVFTMSLRGVKNVAIGAKRRL